MSSNILTERVTTAEVSSILVGILQDTGLIDANDLILKMTKMNFDRADINAALARSIDYGEVDLDVNFRTSVGTHPPLAAF